MGNGQLGHSLSIFFFPDTYRMSQSRALHSKPNTSQSDKVYQIRNKENIGLDVNVRKTRPNKAATSSRQEFANEVPGLIRNNNEMPRPARCWIWDASHTTRDSIHYKC